MRILFILSWIPRASPCLGTMIHRMCLSIDPLTPYPNAPFWIPLENRSSCYPYGPPFPFSTSFFKQLLSRMTPLPFHVFFENHITTPSNSFFTGLRTPPTFMTPFWPRLKTLFNIVEDRFNFFFLLWCQCCIMMFRRVNKRPGMQIKFWIDAGTVKKSMTEYHHWINDRAHHFILTP